MTIFRALLVLLLFSAPILANDIACTEAALNAEISRINSCAGDYATAGCQPPLEFCASSNTLDGGDTATCCSGENAGTCDEGRIITFNCGATTIYIDHENGLIKYCEEGLNSQSCTVDGNCAGSDCDTAIEFCPETGPNTVNIQYCTAANTPYQCCTGNGTGTCCSGSYTNRIITADYVIVDGENNITLQLDPPGDYYYDQESSDPLHSGESPTRFRAQGDYITMRNFTMRDFVKGIESYGSKFLTVDNVTMVAPIDFAFAALENLQNQDLAEDATLKNSTIDQCYDKCVESTSKDEARAYPNYRGLLIDNTFRSPRVGIQISGGRWFIHGNEFNTDIATERNRQTQYALRSGANSGDDPVFYLEDNTFDGSYRCAIRVEQYTSVISLGGNTYQNMRGCGVVFLGNTKGLFEGDTFKDNGGIYNSSTDEEGGVRVKHSSTVDLGGGFTLLDGRGNLSSQGNNLLVDNASFTDATEDVWNGTSQTVMAEGNWWGADADPTAKINEDPGTVDWSPRLTQAPGGVVCGDGSIDLPEVCDTLGPLLGGYDCTDCPGCGGLYNGGTLGCLDGCALFDTSSCTPITCGDGEVQGSEVCDPPIIPQNCADQGFVAGTMGCAADCLSFDSSGCYLGTSGVTLKGVGLR